MGKTNRKFWGTLYMKKLLLYFLALLFFVFPQAVKADLDDWAIIQITETGYDNRYPKISGSNVVWVGDVGGTGYYDIFYYDGGTAVQLTNTIESDWRPQISGSNVAWQGYYGDDWEIFFYDGATMTTTQITTGGYNGVIPQLSGSNIVWQYYDGNDTEILYYDGATITQLTNNTWYNRDPRISGSTVVFDDWDGNDWEIYSYNGVTTTQFTDNDYDDFDPDISGSNVAWAGQPDGVGTDYEIFFYNGTTTTQITDNESDDEYPKISASNIVWENYVPCVYTLFYYNGSTTTQLTSNEYGWWHHYEISGSNVVWDDWDGHDWEIYFYDGVTTTQLTDNSLDDFIPAISGSNLAWSEGHVGVDDHKIFLAIHDNTPYTYQGGTGTSNDPYRIGTAMHLDILSQRSNDWDECYELVADIDMSTHTDTSIDIIGNSTTPFTGVFDANDHIISNFAYDSTGTDYIGLFGFIGAGGQVKDLGLENVDVDGGTGDYVGGLAGRNSGAISRCYATGYVNGTMFWDTGETGDIVGGLVGFNDGTISNCYSTTSVNDRKFYFVDVTGNLVGGLVGSNDGTISNSYAAGVVDGNDLIGGLVGYDNGGSYTPSLWDITVNSSLAGIGNTTEPNVIGETTENMQTRSTFTDKGWDFINIWGINEGIGYPYLLHLTDTDADGIDDDVDNCLSTPNPDQIDTDGDGAGNACDGCPDDPNKTNPGVCGCGIPETDTDIDNIPDCTDNCVNTYNPDQYDMDADGKGDECDCLPDLTNNDVVNSEDFGVFALHWLETGCIAPDFCSACDFDKSTAVGIEDLVAIAELWLGCTIP